MATHKMGPTDVLKAISTVNIVTYIILYRYLACPIAHQIKIFLPLSAGITL
jgi:hypothetical protein